MIVTFVVIATALVLGAISLCTEAVRLRRHPEDDVGDAAVSERFLSRRLQRLERWPQVGALVNRRLDPGTASGLLMTTMFFVVFVTALLIGVVLDWVTNNDGLAEFDSSLAQWGANNASDSSREVLRVLTEMGASWVVAILLLGAAIYDFVKHRNGHVFSFVALVGIGQYLLVNGLKLVVARERPSINQLVEVTSYSWPSGHATAAAACYAGAIFVYTRHAPPRTRLLGGALAVVVATAIAASRTLLGVHWLTDVTAGVVLGWGWCTVIVVAFSRQMRPLAPLMERIRPMVDA